MAENKTQPTARDVTEFLESISDPQRRADCFTLVAMLKKATKAEPKMWGDSIVGFGDIHYKYESGREGDWFPVGFSPRKQAITVYLCGYLAAQQELLSGLGKFKMGKGCLYIKSLADIDRAVFRKLVSATLKDLKRKHP